MRLIDADAFLKDILTAGIGKTIIEYSESDIGYMIRKRPTIDVATVRHGRWEEAIEPLGWNKVIVASCSLCGDSWVLDEFTIDEYAKWHQYCPSCGARMDGYIQMPDTEVDDDGDKTN